jgi:hypothetical protein
VIRSEGEMAAVPPVMLEMLYDAFEAQIAHWSSGNFQYFPRRAGSDADPLPWLFSGEVDDGDAKLTRERSALGCTLEYTLATFLRTVGVFTKGSRNIKNS